MQNANNDNLRDFLLSASLDFTCPLFVSMEAYYIHDHETMNGEKKLKETNGIQWLYYFLTTISSV